MPFDPKLPTRTRDGRKVRILATDARSVCPIVALVEAFPDDEVPGGNQVESVETFYEDGRFSMESIAIGSGWDLVNVDAEP